MRQRGNQWHSESLQTFASASYRSFDEILSVYLAPLKEKPEVASFGIAGPVENQRVRATNLPWEIDAAHLTTTFGWASTWLMNDLEAMAWGIDALDAQGIKMISAGSPRSGNRALIAAGTGLGESILFWDERAQVHRPSPSEGGHVDFAPRDEEEIGLLRFAMARHARVSYERLVSGTYGFRLITEYLCECCSFARDPEIEAAILQKADLGALIARLAEAGHPLACKVLSMFFSMLAAEAGNLALKAMAVNGVWIGGGIALKNQGWLTRPEFLDAFAAKGRFSPMVRAIPIHLITDPLVSLKGAAIGGTQGLSVG
jgi:glucokinase